MTHLVVPLDVGGWLRYHLLLMIAGDIMAHCCRGESVIRSGYSPLLLVLIIEDAMDQDAGDRSVMLLSIVRITAESAAASNRPRRASPRNFH